ncbi:hypothetical protein [Gracilibacillus sp. YIM 98692]|uniref:hypothetical protein n=1 Tax=Gracilibacillus sp. YIM 98692 TaxID=2663532 RepID=UPI0013D75F72|nr:hypothetical protein [Gracilibacillus sp. YIM 98692]
MSTAKAFLHERVIYEYLEYRTKQNKLYLYKTFSKGKRVLKRALFKVNMIKPIETSFPDINEMLFEGTNRVRPAEVKFLTSLFDYHKIDKYDREFNKFKKENGCIIVLKHDLLPNGLINKFKVDIYEIDIEDFRAFVIENFNRLIQKQLQNRDNKYQKIWLTSQVNNFYHHYRTYPVKPARLSGIWCPTNNLTSFDLAKGDKILFVKSGGEFQIKQKLNKYWKDQNAIYPNWKLQKLFVGKVTSPIMSREEYCDIHGIDPSIPLWNDEYKSGKTKWTRVFSFEKEREIIINGNKGISVSEAYGDLGELIFPILFDVYTQQNTREITPNQYFSLLEYISSKISDELEASRLLKEKVTNLISNIKESSSNAYRTNHFIENEFRDIENNFLQ